MPFDIYAFADYSGSSPVRQQRKHIVLATLERPAEDVSAILGLSRPELWLELCLLLERSMRQGRRVLFGCDHSYSFPVGFYEFLNHAPAASWHELLMWLCTPKPSLPALGEPIDDELDELLGQIYRTDHVALDTLSWLRHRVQHTALPRTWATAVNQRFGTRLTEYKGGPFWGPNFDPQPTKPDFPFDEGLPEKRLVERVCHARTQKAMKSIYQLGGNGSVGLQSLYGMSYLHHLLAWCRERDIPVFCWPFDGWDAPPDHHVLVEVYPTLYNPGYRSDEEDAKACVTWAVQRDQTGDLLSRPSVLRDDQLPSATLEGWVIGVGR